MIDIHSHILSDVDDGALNLNISMAMARLYVKAGFRKVIATPHYIDGEDNSLKERNKSIMDRLNEEIAKEGLDLKIYLGNELYASMSLLEDISLGMAASLNGTRYILVELPMYDIPLYFESMIYELQLKGYIPIIAHPERNKKIINEPNILYKYVKMGALAQLNMPSLEGLYGKEIKATAEILLKHKMYNFIGTDAHSDGRRSPDVGESLKILKKIADKDYYQRLIFLNGESLIMDQDIVQEEAVEVEKKKGFFSKLFK